MVSRAGRKQGGSAHKPPRREDDFSGLLVFVWGGRGMRCQGPDPMKGKKGITTAAPVWNQRGAFRENDAFGQQARIWASTASY